MRVNYISYFSKSALLLAFVVKNEKKGRTTMIQNETKSPEILKAERQVEQAKARLAEAKRKESAKKRSDENKHKYMMGGIVHKYFPECYGFDEHELNRIIAAAIKSEQCQRIVEIVKRESAGNAGNETHISQNYGTNQSD